MRAAIKFIKNNLKNRKLSGVEIGVEAGINALSISKSLKLKKLYLIDIWCKYTQDSNSYNYNKDYDRVKKKFKNKKNIIIIKGSSAKVAKTFPDNSLDFVYIDANHQYKYIKEDIKIWSTKVKENGYVCGHDYFYKFPGIIKAVDKFTKVNNYKLMVAKNPIVSVDWWFRKGR